MTFEEKLYEREKLGREEGFKDGFKNGEAQGREAERLRIADKLRKKGMSDNEFEELLAD